MTLALDFSDDISSGDPAEWPPDELTEEEIEFLRQKYTVRPEDTYYDCAV